MKNPFISIIIPVLNEEENVEFLSEEITDVMNNTPWRWECLWIDDGSKDRTVEKLTRLAAANSAHRLITHDRNYGQSAALSTGFKHARGEILVTMDGDGQNDPQFIPVLVKELLKNKADLVNGWRQKRRDNIIRRLSSRIANFYRNVLTGEKIKDVGCSLRAFKKQCVSGIPVFKGMHRFFPTLLRLAGYTRVIEIPVNHRPRKHGKTKYGINNRLWVGIIDTFAVCWMRSRMVYPRSKEIIPFEKNSDNSKTEIQ